MITVEELVFLVKKMQETYARQALQVIKEVDSSEISKELALISGKCDGLHDVVLMVKNYIAEKGDKKSG